MIHPRSIGFRLVAWYAGLLIVVFVLVGGLMYAGLHSYLEHDLSAVQFRRARQIAGTLLGNVETTGEAHVVNEINAWFTPETNDRFIRLTRADGSVLFVSSSPPDGSFDARQVTPLATRPQVPDWRRETLPTGGRLLIASVPAVSRGGHAYLVEVGASLAPIEALLGRLLDLLGSALAIVVVIAVTGGYFLIRRALAPVEEITRRAERITLHNLKERLPVLPTGDELERLSVSLNHMIARLDDAFEHNRRFIADASHELRTPLTILRGEMESLISQAEPDSEIQARAGTALEEVVRLAHIVEGLFNVARLDAGEAQKECQRFDLAELTTSTAEQMCLLAEDKGIAISCHAPQPVFVEGDRARLKQVVVNLLDNAIKYTPEHGKVDLLIFAANQRAVLEVADTGIGIPAAAQPRIFQRFFRVDPARSREMGGAGLGLSIVKSICTAHGGEVDFQSREGQGSRFKVQLPLAPATS